MFVFYKPITTNTNNNDFVVRGIAVYRVSRYTGYRGIAVSRGHGFQTPLKS